jgi:hypothetical protein
MLILSKEKQNENDKKYHPVVCCADDFQFLCGIGTSKKAQHPGDLGR